MAIKLVCGAECGITTANTNGTLADRHWSSTPSGAPGIDTEVVRSGRKSYRFAAAATDPFMFRDDISGATVAYWRAYYRFTNVTPSEDCQLASFPVTAANAGLLILRTSGLVETSKGATSGGFTASANTWYGIEMQVDVSANPHRVRWRSWSAATGWVERSEATEAVAASSFSAAGFSFGLRTGPASGLVVYVDDIRFGYGTTVDEDYSQTVPKGGRVLRYRPVSDGAHVFDNGDFEYNDTTALTSGANDLWTYLDDDTQTSLSDFISQNSVGTGEYIEGHFADPLGQSMPRIVGVTSVHHSSGTTANEMHLRVGDGTDWTNIWGDWATTGYDVSATSAFLLHKALATAPDAGPWTLENIKSLRYQWGNTDNVATIPYIDSISLEVDWDEDGELPVGFQGHDDIYRYAEDQHAFQPHGWQLLGFEEAKQVDAFEWDTFSIAPNAFEDDLRQDDPFQQVPLSVGALLMRTLADALNLADNVDRLGAFARTLADSLTASDQVVRVGTFIRTLADSVSYGNTVTRLGTFARTAADSLGFGDTVVRVGTFLRTAADSLSMGNTVVRVGTFLRTASDSLSFSDSVAGVKLIIRTLADALSFGDSVVRVGTFARTATDSLNLADSVARIFTAVRTATDSLSIGNTVARLGTFLRTAADSLSFSDAVEGIKVGAIIRSLTDALSISDSVSRTGSFLRTAADSLSTSTSVVASTAISVIGGIPPVIASVVHAVVSAIASHLGPPGGGASSSKPSGSASHPKPER